MESWEYPSTAAATAGSNPRPTSAIDSEIILDPSDLSRAGTDSRMTSSQGAPQPVTAELSGVIDSEIIIPPKQEPEAEPRDFRFLPATEAPIVIPAEVSPALFLWRMSE